MALSETLAHLAIGLGDGTVILYRHLDQSLSSSTTLTSLPKARTVFESPTEPITGLGFREPSTNDDDDDDEHTQTTHGPTPNDNDKEKESSEKEKEKEKERAQNPSEDDPRNANHYLFIVTTSRVLCYQVSGRGSGGSPSVVDEIGVGLGCAVMDRRKRNVVVAREEAIYGVEQRWERELVSFPLFASFFCCSCFFFFVFLFWYSWSV